MTSFLRLLKSTLVAYVKKYGSALLNLISRWINLNYILFHIHVQERSGDEKGAVEKPNEEEQDNMEEVGQTIIFFNFAILLGSRQT